MENQEKLRNLVEGRVFTAFVQLMILASAIVFALESGRPEDDTYVKYFLIIDYVFCGLFAVEYICRIYAAPKRWGFVFSFFGIIDLLAILPIVLHFTGFRVLRIFRFLRIFRVFKATRFILAVDRLTAALNEVKRELFALLLLSLMLVYLVACGIHYFERENQPEAFGTIFESMWWAIVTLTTVGYGDVYPTTAGGRIFTSLVTLIGIGLISIPSALIASVLTDARAERRKSEETDKTDNAA